MAPRKDNPLCEKVLRYIRELRLMRAGDRVGVAVSGGADSVALLRVLLEVKEELGIVLAVVHVNHQIRGVEAEADEQFVRSLAQLYHQQVLCTSQDVPGYAESKGISLESAGREVRYNYFRLLMQKGHVDKVATAHTADDQAETVLMRLIRGTGTKGLAGIHPIRVEEQGSNTKDTKGTKAHKEGAIVRPMLGVRRREVERYLRELKQDWREDTSNRDQRLLRNRVRHTLLPLLEHEFNPRVVEVLADVAEIARAEEDFWNRLVEERLEEAGGRRQGAGGKLARKELEMLLTWPLAVQRRVLREIGRRAGLRLEFREVEKIRKLAGGMAGREIELSGGWVARVGREGLRLEQRERVQAGDFEYALPVPGQVQVPQLGTVIKAFLLANRENRPEYNPAQALDRKKLAPELIIRNWRAGDRFWPAHSKSEKKVKELLQAKRVPEGERKGWPVAVSRGTIVWVRGMAPGQEFAAGPECREAVVIEEIASP